MILSFFYKKATLLLPLLLIAAGGVMAQATIHSSTASKTKIKKPKPTSKEFSFGVRLTSDGYGIYAEKSSVRSENAKTRDMFYNTRFYQIGIEEHKSPKEVKRSFVDPTGGGEKSKPFIYGKLNNFYSLKLGYGFRKLIAGKPEAGTVSIHWMGAGGASIGFLKPYYIDAYAPEGGNGPLVKQSIKYTQDTKDYFLNPYYIVGSSGFAKGIGETQIVPGVQLSTALHFDFAPTKRHVLAVETGVSAEYYSKNIELMANQDSKPYFVNLYAAFQYGWRK